MRFGVPLFRPHVLQPPGDPLHVLAAGDVFDVRKKQLAPKRKRLAVVLLNVLIITCSGEVIFQYFKVMFTESMIQLNAFAFGLGKC